MSEEKIYPLGYKTYTLSVSVFKEEPTIHNRKKRELVKETFRFSTARVALFANEWRDLMSIHLDIVALINTSTSISHYWELGTRGRPVAIRGYQGKAYIDLRNFWIPPNETQDKPTSICAVLDSTGFLKLKDYEIFIRVDIRRIGTELESMRRWTALTNASMAKRRQVLEAAEAAAAFATAPPTNGVPGHDGGAGVLPDLPTGEIVEILEISQQPEPKLMMQPQPAPKAGPSNVSEAQEVPPLTSYYLDVYSDEEDNEEVHILKVELAARRVKSSMTTICIHVVSWVGWLVVKG